MKKIALPQVDWKNPLHWLALGGGTGYSAYAPGTTGTLSGVLCFLLLHQCDFSQVVNAIVIVITFLIGIPLCGKVAADWGVDDHSCIVWDEVVGYMITGWCVLWVAPDIDLTLILITFIAFRIFDIVKPWPIKWFDQTIHGGIGIMIDDVLAGLMAGGLSATVASAT